MNFTLQNVRRFVIRLSPVLFICTSLYVAISAYVHPEYNWDMVPYIGSAFSISIHNPQAVHNATYSVIKVTIPQHFNNLAWLSTNYYLFQQQLPFYTVKPLYIGLVYLLWQLGFNIVHATVLISVISYLLISLVIFLSLWKMKAHAVLYFMATLFISTAPFFELARLSTPDALSVGIIMFAIYFTFIARVNFLGELLLVLSVLARPDDLIFVGLLSLYLAFSPQQKSKTKRITLVTSTVLSVVVYFIVGHFAHGYGYSVLFENTFIHVLSAPATYTGHVTPQAYVTALAKGIVDLGKTTMVFPFALTTIATIFILKSTSLPPNIREFRNVIVVSLITFVIHFALFPSPDDRFFAAEYAVIMICLFNLIDFFTKATSKRIDWFISNKTHETESIALE